MWETIKEFIMAWLDPIGIILGLLISIPIIWTWYEVIFGKRHQYKKWHREIRKQPGKRPGILIIDLLPGKNVSADIENFRQQSKQLQPIPKDRIISIRRDKKITPDDMVQLSIELQEKAAQLMGCGIDTLHYFHAGPAVVAALAGAEFANSCRVMLYQHQPGKYINFGPLQREE